MKFTLLALSLSLLIPAAGPAQDDPGLGVPSAISASVIQESSIPAHAASPASEPVTTPAPVADKPVLAPQIRPDACRASLGFYGLGLGAVSGIYIARRTHDSMSIFYSLIGGWALGTMASYFTCR